MPPMLAACTWSATRWAACHLAASRTASARLANGASRDPPRCSDVAGAAQQKRQNDARGLAQLVRSGWYRAVHVNRRQRQSTPPRCHCGKVDVPQVRGDRCPLTHFGKSKTAGAHLGLASQWIQCPLEQRSAADKLHWPCSPAVISRSRLEVWTDARFAIRLPAKPALVLIVEQSSCCIEFASSCQPSMHQAVDEQQCRCS
jgi:hypothetical protein